MSKVIAVGYDERATAEQVRDALVEIAHESPEILDLKDILVITRDADGDLFETSLSDDEEEALRAAIGDR